MADAIAEVTPAAPKRDSFDLEAAAADFYERFPDYAGRVSFVDVTKGSIINSEPEKVQELIDAFSSAEGRAKLGPIIARCQKTQSPYSLFAPDGDCIIFMYTEDDRPRFFGGAVSPVRELQFIFDHETGHVVVPAGSSDDRLKAENAADAFALLCDMKRHGDTNLAEAALIFRASYALFSKNGMINFSAPMIENFIAEHEKFSKKELTPQTIVSLAEELADHETLPQDKAQCLFESLAKLQQYPSLSTLTDVTLKTPLPETFKWTSIVLKNILSGRGTLPGTTAEAFNEAARRAPAEMERREQEFARRRAPAQGMAAAPA